MSVLGRRKFVTGLVAMAGAAGATGWAAWGEAAWRAATMPELERLLPARAPVEKERIETEMRTATGITDGRHSIAAVVLITAGYAADGKYSHYLMVGAPLRLGTEAAGVRLPVGTYVLGWHRNEAGLDVHVFEAETGREVGGALATLGKEHLRVEPFHIWPPKEGIGVQIGRFTMPYSLG